MDTVEPCFIFSWNRHNEHCTKITPVPYVLPGSLLRIPEIVSGYYDLRVVGVDNVLHHKWADALSAASLGCSVELV